MTRLEQILERLDAENALDPNHEPDESGQDQPKELLYGRRMSTWLATLRADAPEALQIAARAQHVRRWDIPRDSFPMDRRGYLVWRKKLYTHHGDVAERLMRDCDYDDATIERVRFLLQKRQLGSDPDTQALEDAACLVFLQFHYAAFAQRTEADKMVGILQKTWGKMSEKAHALALGLDYPPEALALIQRALSSPSNDESPPQ